MELSTVAVTFDGASEGAEVQRHQTILIANQLTVLNQTRDLVSKKLAYHLSATNCYHHTDWTPQPCHLVLEGVQLKF